MYKSEMVRAAALACLMVLIVGVNAQNGSPPPYSCNPATCQPPNCKCASTDIPGNLPRSSTPQMILVTFDDALHISASAYAMQILNQTLKNPNGCPIPGTFYVSLEYTQYEYVKWHHSRGDEIAVHTMTHTTSAATNYSTWQQEIVWARGNLSQGANIPLGDIRGFRCPFLATSNEHFRVLYENGFLYDSSVTELLGSGSMSSDPGHWLWPYTWDNLGAQNCDAGGCPERPYPGLWEMPMWMWYDPQWNIYGGMDPPGSYEVLLEMFKRHFTARYEGNRAPMGWFLHPSWAAFPDNIRAFNDFTQWALAKGDVWFVTNRQLIEWVKSPKTNAQMGAFATCPPPMAPSAPPTPPCQGNGYQCGGDGYTGATCCVSGTQCMAFTSGYSQCRTDCPAGWQCATKPPTAPSAPGSNPSPPPPPVAPNCAGPATQCGGAGWTGATCCTAGSNCYAFIESYSQCRVDCPPGWLCNSMPSPPGAVPAASPTASPMNAPMPPPVAAPAPVAAPTQPAAPAPVAAPAQPAAPAPVAAPAQPAAPAPRPAAPAPVAAPAQPAAPAPATSPNCVGLGWQCGGEGWDGAKCCTTGSCMAYIPSYSQCRTECPPGWMCNN